MSLNTRQGQSKITPPRKQNGANTCWHVERETIHFVYLSGHRGTLIPAGLTERFRVYFNECSALQTTVGRQAKTAIVQGLEHLPFVLLPLLRHMTSVRKTAFLSPFLYFLSLSMDGEWQMMFISCCYEVHHLRGCKCGSQTLNTTQLSRTSEQA